jgi:hypothetical protein
MSTKLDANQVLKKVYDEESQRLNTNAIAHVSNISISVDIDKDDDSIAVYNSDGSEIDLDVALSTRASESTLQAVDASVGDVEARVIESNALLTSIDAKVATETTLATRATEATQLLNLAQLQALNTSTDNIEARLDVALSTRASESTLGTRASETTLQSVDSELNTITSQLTTANTTLSSIDTKASYDVESTTGTITAVSQTVVCDVDGKAMVWMQALGTFTGTIVFEASIDGTNYQSLIGHVNGLMAAASQITAANLVMLRATGFTRIRVRASAWTSGTANITFTSSPHESVQSCWQFGTWSTRIQDSAGTTLTANYGAAANSLRVAAQVGNTTGQADFNTGTAGAQTLRTISGLQDNTGTVISSSNPLHVQSTTLNGYLSPYEDFGSASNLAAAFNSAVTLTNTNGYNSICFNLTIPTGATVTFESTADGTNWTACTLRQKGGDNYITSTTTSGEVIGSISGARSFRVRVSSAGSAAGSVIGRVTRDVSTLEGIENGPPSEFYYDVSRGKIGGVEGLTRFGRNPDVDTGSKETIWGYGGSYTFTTSAQTYYISSSSASDTTQTITLNVLDSNYTEQTRTVTLAGQTKTAISGGTIIRINGAYNSSGTNLIGDVYIYEDDVVAAGVPTTASKVKAFIPLTEQNSALGVYTVPAGYTAYLTNWSANCSSGTADITMDIRNFGQVFVNHGRKLCNTNVDVEYKVFLRIPEKSDIRFDTTVSANNTVVSLDYSLILVAN